MVAGKSPEWLPPGFAEKVKYKNGRKIKYYHNVATGTKYHSKKDVLSFAMANNGHLGTPRTRNGGDNKLFSNNKVDAELAKTNDSPEWLPNGWKMEEKTRQSGSRKGAIYKVYTELSSGNKFYSRAALTRYMKTVEHANTKNEQNEVDHVKDPVSDMSPPCISMANAGHVPGKKQKNNSFKTVAIESAAADDLPPGWIKEIKTSKSGNRIRKDPFYTDPVSGYVFRSKLDALRFLETNDIHSCACRPKKRELDDPKLITNEIPPQSPANEKLSEHKRQLFPDGELNGGAASSGTKRQAQLAAVISKQTQDDNELDGVKVTSVEVDENSNKYAEMENNCEPTNGVSEEDLRVCGMNKPTDRTPTDSRKSKKRWDLSSPSRTSKRLAGGEPEITSCLVLNERSLRAAARRSSGIKVDTLPNVSPKALATDTQPAGIEPAKEDPKHETLQVPEPLNQVESNPPAIPEDKVVEEQPGENKRSQESEQPADDKRSQESEQPADDKRPQESQFCYDFGDSWSDPLEFALKTLTGEIPIYDPLSFQGGFGEQVSIPENQTLRPPPPEAPIIFRNEFVPPSEPSKQKSPANQFAPNSSSFSALGNLWNGFNSQPSTAPTSSSFSALGNLWNGFNSQPSTDAGKTNCPTKFKP